MDARTLEALKASIEHWRENENAERLMEVDFGSSSCPLCQLFFDGSNKKRTCRGCPVMTSTGRIYCSGTPYREVQEAFFFDTFTAFKLAARAEREFLESLLPKEEATPCE
jgi:hypothetical protein